MCVKNAEGFARHATIPDDIAMLAFKLPIFWALIMIGTVQYEILIVKD
jgi:hypothetical protein